MLKKILLLLILVCTVPWVFGQNYNVEFIEYGHFTAYNSNNTLLKLDEENSLTFLDLFQEGIEEKTNFSFNYNSSPSNYSPIWIFISDNKGNYSIQTDGHFYFIRFNPNSPLNENELRSELFNEFSFNANKIKYRLDYAINSINEWRGSISPQQYGEISIFNIYNYKMKNLNCDKEQNSIITDCSHDPFVNKITNNFWGDIKVQKIKSYSQGYNLILANLDYFHSNKDYYPFIGMNSPMIVISEGEFASSVKSGQSFFVYSLPYIENINNLKNINDKLEISIEDISNYTSQVYTDLELIKRESQKENNEEKVKNLIINKSFDYNKTKLYLERLSFFQKEINKLNFLLGLNRDNYYNDLYTEITNEQLTELNSNLLVYEKKVEIFTQLQDTYNSFTLSILSDIHSSDDTRKQIWWGLGWGLFILLLDILIYHLMEHYQKRKKKEYLVKKLLSNLNKTAEMSESYKELFLQTLLSQYTIHQLGTFKISCNQLFGEYINIKNQDSSKWADLIQSQLKEDKNINKNMLNFIKKESKNISVGFIPDFFIDPALFSIDETDIIFGEFNEEIENSLKKVSENIKIINRQILTGRVLQAYSILGELDKQIVILFNKIKNSYPKTKPNINYIKLLIKRN